MLDINKMVAQEHAEPTSRDHLIELEPWTEERAIEMARQDGLELTDAHLGIIRYLRDCYADHGGTVNARMLMQSLEEEFAGMGGHRFLYTLFPMGADRTGQPLCRTANSARHARPVVRHHALK